MDPPVPTFLDLISESTQIITNTTAEEGLRFLFLPFAGMQHWYLRASVVLQAALPSPSAPSRTAAKSFTTAAVR
jgi:hypothetical protein